MSDDLTQITEVFVWCPDCIAGIYLSGKNSNNSFMMTAGNADYIHITCPKCKFEFLIYETDYDKRRKK